VNLVTLIGVILAVPFFAKMMKENEAAFASLLGGFCGGAIIACAFLLLLLESSHFFNEWTDEVDVVWRWGTSVLAGFFFPTVVQVLTGVIFAGAGHEHGTAAQQDVEATESSEKKELAQEDPSARARLFAAVIIGDGFHNLCDGFFIGAAFKACGPSFGWTASLSSILHEIPQELADYSLLTGSLGRLPAWKALVFNFLSGITVMLGAIIVTEVDVGNTGIGVILAFGGGVYLHVSAVECVPRMYAKGLSNKVRLASMAMFILGTMIIGLVLLKHEHCSPPTDPNADPAEAAADPHAGHNH
jgi:UTP--glucose-1-phosphate uridylyltransferase